MARMIQVVAVLALVVSGCSLLASEDQAVTAPPSSPPEASPSDTPTDEPTATASPSPTPSPTPTPTPTPTATASADNPLGLADGEYPTGPQINQVGRAETCVYAGPEWCEDGNGNIWPDFVEEALGRDPTVDQCLLNDCGGPGLDEFGLAQVQENTLFVLDASGSMAGAAGGGQTKMDAAKSALVEYVTITPEFADLGLLVYGHQGDNSEAGRPASCAGIDTFAALGDLTFENVEGILGQFQPTGWTPIAAALDAAGPVVQAAAAADAAEGLEGVTNRIILISDGIETCGGDPVASAQALVDLGINVVVDVIGFDIPDSDRAALQQVAETTGGVYSDAADGDALRDVLSEYDAQRVAVTESLDCQVQAIVISGNCYTALSQEADGHIQGLRQEALDEGDDARAAFLFSWSSAARQTSVAQTTANTQRLREQFATLQELYDEAVARREAFYAGEPVNKPIGRPVTFDCPYDRSAATRIAA